MTSPNIGPVYRSTADILDAHVPGLTDGIEKLRQKILKRLAPKPKVQGRFDKDWKDAETTRGRIQAAMEALRRVANMIGKVGEIAGQDLNDTYTELRTLIDLLRLLLWLEDQAKQYRDLAKAHGY